jgi:hypothetical protein
MFRISTEGQEKKEKGVKPFDRSKPESHLSGLAI